MVIEELLVTADIFKLIIHLNELPASKFIGSEPVRACLCQEIVLLEHPGRGMYDVIQNFEVI